MLFNQQFRKHSGIHKEESLTYSWDLKKWGKCYTFYQNSSVALFAKLFFKGTMCQMTKT